MIDFFFSLFWIFSLINIKIKEIDNFFNDYMDINNTNSIKGIFVWMILFTHKKEYGLKKTLILSKVTYFLGQNIVVMFLFYSGFGINESLNNKGIIYSKTLLYKAIILFLKSQIIILFFLAANIFILKRKITLRQYILSIIFKSAIQNSNWLAFTIIIFYIYVYLSFYISKKINFGLIILNLICFIHVYFVYNYYFPKCIHTVETTLSFVSGFYYSLIHKQLDTILMKNDIRYLAVVSTIICIYYNFTNIGL